MLCTFIVVAALLPAIVRGAPGCDGGSMESSDVDGILKNINDRRSSLVQGNQRNGAGQDNLPAGKYMTQMYWSCDLEKEAMSGTNADCSTTTPSGRTEFIWTDEEALKILPASALVENWLDRINEFPLTDYKDGAIKYSADPAIEYANLINPKATEIGCAFGTCTDDGDSMYTLYCLTNKDPLASGDTIYEEGSGGCENCPDGTTCDDTTKLCSKEAALTTTTTTTSTTTSTTTTTSTSTTSTTSTTTTTTTTGEAIYPTGENTKCPDHEGMNDTLRMHYLDTHNFRRSVLAKGGNVTRINGNPFPQAANMIKLELDCELEAGAIAYAGTCPYAVSDPSTREGIGEHYHRVPISSTVPTHRDGIKNAVTNWFKVVRQYPSPGNKAIFRANHVGTPIETFTQIGWAKTSKLGCSIVICKSDYVVICRYYPKGNIVEQNMYIPGTPCSQCMGTCYSSDLGLCTA